MFILGEILKPVLIQIKLTRRLKQWSCWTQDPKITNSKGWLSFSKKVCFILCVNLGLISHAKPKQHFSYSWNTQQRGLHLTCSRCASATGWTKVWILFWMLSIWWMGDFLTIRHCRVSDTSTEGIYIMSSNDVLLEKNIFTRNNIEKITGYYPAAVKIFNQCYRVTCQDNLVIDLPYSNGIWYDVGNVDGRFLNNWIEGVGNKRCSQSRQGDPHQRRGGLCGREKGNKKNKAFPYRHSQMRWSSSGMFSLQTTCFDRVPQPQFQKRSASLGASYTWLLWTRIERRISKMPRMKPAHAYESQKPNGGGNKSWQIQK